MRAVVRASTSHPTAQEIYYEVRHTRPKIGLATVYRILHQLSQQGMIKVWGYGSQIPLAEAEELVSGLYRTSGKPALVS